MLERYGTRADQDQSNKRKIWESYLHGWTKKLIANFLRVAMDSLSRKRPLTLR